MSAPQFLQCSKCLLYKHEDQFPLSFAKRRGGRQAWCRSCKSAWDRADIQKNGRRGHRKEQRVA